MALEGRPDEAGGGEGRRVSQHLFSRLAAGNVPPWVENEVCCFFFAKQKTAYEITRCLEFTRVLFRSAAETLQHVMKQPQPRPRRVGIVQPRYLARRRAADYVGIVRLPAPVI